MKLSVKLDTIKKEMGLVRTAELLQEAGFQYVDYTPDLANYQKEEFKKELEILSAHGVEVYQSHAPFYRYRHISSREEHKRRVELSLEAAAEAGARFLVIHGDEYDIEHQAYTPEKVLEYNYEYFAPIVDKAVRKGINIAFENVFQDHVTWPRYCSKVEELITLIDKFACPEVCCCWDFGHGAMSYQEKQHEAITAMGSRIRCTHVHDNYMKADLHLVPFLGKIDWEECMKAFWSVADTEVLSFELHYARVTETTASHYAKFLYATGCQLFSYNTRKDKPCCVH